MKNTINQKELDKHFFEEMLINEDDSGFNYIQKCAAILAKFAVINYENSGKVKNVLEINTNFKNPDYTCHFEITILESE